jgi:hypothetical protein
MTFHFNFFDAWKFYKTFFFFEKNKLECLYTVVLFKTSVLLASNVTAKPSVTRYKCFRHKHN